MRKKYIDFYDNSKRLVLRLIFNNGITIQYFREEGEVEETLLNSTHQMHTLGMSVKED